MIIRISWSFRCPAFSIKKLILGGRLLEYVVEMLNIRKQFGDFVANNNINLQVKPGEIHALLGENGAGKSTLMNVLFGLYELDGGEIRVKGKKENITSPNKANDLGIGMVHQHFMLVDKFTVAENIILGHEPSRLGLINKKEAIKEIEALSNKYGLQIDPHKRIDQIGVGMQQRVEILKTLYRGADILIFDEPTAVLTPQEIIDLMGIMKLLVKEGKSIILITHKLKEIMTVCDRVTVIRKGEGIGTVNVAQTSPQELANMMVGRAVLFSTAKKAAHPTDVVLSINDLVVAEEKHKIEKVSHLSLEVKAGEVLGIAGIDGNGQTELIEAITGLRKVKHGTIQLNGEKIHNLKPRQITEKGLGHIPEDRHKHGLVLEMSLANNIALQTYYQKPLSKHGFLNQKEIDRFSNGLIKEYDVRTSSEHVPAGKLSGGNQQKAIIAREIDRSPQLLIAAQPTRGLDVGAIEFIHKRLIEQRDQGRAVVLMSYELEEILNVSDRIAVIYEGRIVAILDAKETNEQELGLYMAGEVKANV